MKSKLNTTTVSLYFLYNKRQIAEFSRIHENSAVSKAIIGKRLKSVIINIDF